VNRVRSVAAGTRTDATAHEAGREGARLADEVNSGQTDGHTEDQVANLIA